MTAVEQYEVRPDYVHSLAEACQRFAGAVLAVEPDSLMKAVAQLISDRPAAGSPAEAFVGSTMLKDAVVRGASCQHTLFHRWFDRAPCAFRPQPIHALYMPLDDGSPSALTQWAADYAQTFERVHSWPAAVRAAQLLQEAVADAWYVDELARVVNVSAATLRRGFQKIYGLTVQQYQSLVRLRSVAETVRSRRGVVEGAILAAGCRSMKDVYRPFRRITGLTVAGVRSLSESQFTSLMSGPLRLPVPGQHEKRVHQLPA